MRCFFTIIILLLFYACRDNKASSYTYDVLHILAPTQETAFGVSELVSDIDYIKLNDSLSESHFSQLDKLIITDDRLYLFELRGNNRVLAFDKDGNFLHSIGRRGRGPGEYQQLLNFTVVGNDVLLLDNQQKQMLYYDSYGNYKNTKKMPFRAKDVVALDNGNFMFMLLKGDTDNKRNLGDKKVIITDTDFNLLETQLTYSDNDLQDFMWMSNFNRADNEIIFAHPVCDTVYVFDSANGAIKSAFYMDFADRKVPSDMRDSYMKIFEAREYCYLRSVPVVVGDYIVGGVTMGDKAMTYALNRKTKEVVVDRYNIGEDYNIRSINLPLTQSNESIATIVYYSLIEDGAFEKNNLPEDVCEFITSGGYVVCLMRI